MSLLSETPSKAELDKRVVARAKARAGEAAAAAAAAAPPAQNGSAEATTNGSALNGSPSNVDSAATPSANGSVPGTTTDGKPASSTTQSVPNGVAGSVSFNPTLSPAMRTMEVIDSNWIRAAARRLTLKDVAAWDATDTGAWVATVGFPEYRLHFLNNHITANELFEMDMESLKSELDIQSYGHRKLIMRKIQDLQRARPAAEALIFQQDLSHSLNTSTVSASSTTTTSSTPTSTAASANPSSPASDHKTLPGEVEAMVQDPTDHSFFRVKISAPATFNALREKISRKLGHPPESIRSIVTMDTNPIFKIVDDDDLELLKPGVKLQVEYFDVREGNPFSQHSRPPAGVASVSSAAAPAGQRPPTHPGATPDSKAGSSWDAQGPALDELPLNVKKSSDSAASADSTAQQATTSQPDDRPIKKAGPLSDKDRISPWDAVAPVADSRPIGGARNKALPGGSDSAQQAPSSTPPAPQSKLVKSVRDSSAALLPSPRTRADPWAASGPAMDEQPLNVGRSKDKPSPWDQAYPAGEQPPAAATQPSTNKGSQTTSGKANPVPKLPPSNSSSNLVASDDKTPKANPWDTTAPSLDERPLNVGKKNKPSPWDQPYPPGEQPPAQESEPKPSASRKGRDASKGDLLAAAASAPSPGSKPAISKSVSSSSPSAADDKPPKANPWESSGPSLDERPLNVGRKDKPSPWDDAYPPGEAPPNLGPPSTKKPEFNRFKADANSTTASAPKENASPNASKKDQATDSGEGTPPSKEKKSPWENSAPTDDRPLNVGKKKPSPWDQAYPDSKPPPVSSEETPTKKQSSALAQEAKEMAERRTREIADRKAQETADKESASQKAAAERDAVLKQAAADREARQREEQEAREAESRRREEERAQREKEREEARRREREALQREQEQAAVTLPTTEEPVRPAPTPSVPNALAEARRRYEELKARSAASSNVATSWDSPPSRPAVVVTPQSTEPPPSSPAMEALARLKKARENSNQSIEERIARIRERQASEAAQRQAEASAIASAESSNAPDSLAAPSTVGGSGASSLRDVLDARRRLRERAAALSPNPALVTSVSPTQDLGSSASGISAAEMQAAALKKIQTRSPAPPPPPPPPPPNPPPLQASGSTISFADGEDNSGNAPPDPSTRTRKMSIGSNDGTLASVRAARRAKRNPFEKST